MHGATLTGFANCASRRFGSMATSGDIDFQAVAWFNGELFDENGLLSLDRSEIAPSILATPIWSRSLDCNRSGPGGRNTRGRHRSNAVPREAETFRPFSPPCHSPGPERM